MPAPIAGMLFESSALRLCGARESAPSGAGLTPPSPAARLTPGWLGSYSDARPSGRARLTCSLGRAHASLEAPQSVHAPLGAWAQLSRCGGFYLFRLRAGRLRPAGGRAGWVCGSHPCGLSSLPPRLRRGTGLRAAARCFAVRIAPYRGFSPLGRASGGAAHALRRWACPCWCSSWPLLRGCSGAAAVAAHWLRPLRTRVRDSAPPPRWACPRCYAPAGTRPETGTGGRSRGIALRACPLGYGVTGVARCGALGLSSGARLYRGCVSSCPPLRSCCGMPPRLPARCAFGVLRSGCPSARSPPLGLSVLLPLGALLGLLRLSARVACSVSPHAWQRCPLLPALGACLRGCAPPTPSGSGGFA